MNVLADKQKELFKSFLVTRKKREKDFLDLYYRLRIKRKTDFWEDSH